MATYDSEIPLIDRVQTFEHWSTTCARILDIEGFEDVLAACTILTGMSIPTTTSEFWVREAVCYIYNRAAIEWELWSQVEMGPLKHKRKDIRFQFYENFRESINAIGLDFDETKRSYTVATKTKKKVASGKKTVDDKAPKKKKRLTIMAFMKDMLEKDPEVTTQEMIVGVKAKFPESKFNKSHASWYRNYWRKHGLDIPKLHKRDKKEDGEKTAVKKKVVKKKKVTKKMKVAKQ